MSTKVPIAPLGHPIDSILQGIQLELQSIRVSLCTDKNRQEQTRINKKLFIINNEYDILKNDLLVLF